MSCAHCVEFPKRSVHYERDLETSPSLHRLSTTNFPATEQDASHIKNTILPGIEADISSMTAKITAFQATLQSMERERDALEAVQKQYRHIIHPHRALPPEVWSEIFLLANDGVVDACDPSGPLWGLSQVCRPWRDIALSLHSLWSTMFVDLMPSAGGARILELVLQRTGQCPLDITLDNDHGDARAGRPSDVHALSLLRDRVLRMSFAESHRWRTLEILQFPQNSGILFAPLSGRLPQLESLSLYFSPDSTPVAESQPVNSAFRDCPHLTKVALTGKLPLIDLPYARITDLFIEKARPLFHEDCLAYITLVGQCTSLEKLCVIGSLTSFSAPLTPPAMIHSNLYKFTTGCDPLIDCLTLPGLEEAVLSTRHHFEIEHPNILPSFDRLLRRSHCTSLTKLDIIDLRLADHLLVSILSQIPSLTTLHLRAPMADRYVSYPNRPAMQEAREFMQALQNVAFLPRVSSLQIHLTGHQDRDELPTYFEPRGSFSAMVKARWEGDAERGLAKLETFHFSLSAGASAWLSTVWDDIQPHILDRLVDDGMDLTVRVKVLDDGPDGETEVCILTVG